MTQTPQQLGRPVADPYRPAIEHLSSAAAARLLTKLEETEAQARILEELLMATAGADDRAEALRRDRVDANRALIRHLIQHRAGSLKINGDP
jgi:hypothetical protein